MADIPYRPMVKTPWSGSRSARPMGAPSQEMMTPMAPSQGALDMVNVGMNGVGNYAPPSTGIVNPPTPVPPPPAMGTYGAMGLTPPPATQIHQGQQTPGYYQSIGAPNPSGINMGHNGYYMPGVQPPMSQGETAQQIGDRAIAQNRQPLDARWAMQYPNGAPIPQQRQPEPPASMQNLPVGMPQPGGTRVTSRVVAVPDSEHGTRKVVLGMNTDPSRVPDKRERITVDTGGDYKTLTPDQLKDNRDAYRQRAADRKASLAEGRRQRAINEYGLDHLKPSDSSGSQDSSANRGGPQVGGQEGAPSPTGAAGSPGSQAPAADLANRQLMLNKTLQHPTFVSNKESFNGETASLAQSMAFYAKNSAKWSESDRKNFKDFLDSRYGLDHPETGQFKKDLDQILSANPTNPFAIRSPDGKWVNDIRSLYGLPPVKFDARSKAEIGHTGKPPESRPGVPAIPFTPKL